MGSSNRSRGGGGGKERRRYKRYDVRLHVDVSSESTFLFSYVSNISEMGIFVSSHEPMAVGTVLKLRFRSPEDDEEFDVDGEVMWVNPVRKDGDTTNAGMGVHFINLDDAKRARIVQLIHTIAYLHDNWV